MIEYLENGSIYSLKILQHNFFTQIILNLVKKSNLSNFIDIMPKRKMDESSDSDDSKDEDWENEDDPPIKGDYIMCGVRFLYVYDHHIICCCRLSYRCL